MERDMLFREENIEREDELGEKTLKVKEFWKCSSKTESVYVNVFYTLAVLGKNCFGGDAYALCGNVCFDLDRRGELRFDREKKKWYMHDAATNDDVDDFYDDELCDSNCTWYESTEFEKEVYAYWTKEVVHRTENMKELERLNSI